MSAEAGDSEQQRSRGLFSSIQTMAGTLVAIVQTRIELLSTDWEEERVRLTSMLLWGFITLFCASLGIIFLALLCVLALWDENRLLAVGLPAGGFLLAAAISLGILAKNARAKPRLFAATLAELAKDRKHLEHNDE